MTPTFDITDWQLFVYALFSFLILFSAWQGWLHGLGRTALMLGGVPLGYLTGKGLGFLIIEIYRNFIPYPEPILKEMTNVIFAVLAYLVFVTSAIFLFKSTQKQEGLRNKLISGIGGTFFGICNGLIVAVVICVFVRFFGVLNLNIPPAPGTLEYRQKQEVFLPEHSAQSDKFIVRFYRAIYSPPIEKWVTAADPTSEDKYTLLKNLKILSERQDLLSQLTQSPEVTFLLQTPEIASILEGSNVEFLINEGRFHDLLKDPAFRELYKRKASADLLSAVDWINLTNLIIEGSDLSNNPEL